MLESIIGRHNSNKTLVGRDPQGLCHMHSVLKNMQKLLFKLLQKNIINISFKRWRSWTCEYKERAIGFFCSKRILVGSKDRRRKESSDKLLSMMHNGQGRDASGYLLLTYVEGLSFNLVESSFKKTQGSVVRQRTCSLIISWCQSNMQKEDRQK